MAKDKRKKGCPNADCALHAKHTFQKPENCYCPACGTKLVYVCRNCFSPLDEQEPDRTVCTRCEEKQKAEKEAKQEQKDRNAARISAIAGAAGGILAGIGAAVSAVAAGKEPKQKKQKGKARL